MPNPSPSTSEPCAEPIVERSPTPTGDASDTAAVHREIGQTQKGGTRPRTLTVADAKLIAVEIGSLPQRVRPDWNEIVAITRRIEALKPGWSRMTLSKHKIVRDAYVAALAAYRGVRDDGKKKTALRADEATRAELAATKETLRRYDARFALWTHNAYLNHVTTTMLDAPLDHPMD